MTATATTAPAIGQEWPEQGGVFIGTRLIDGVPHHIVTPEGPEFDLVGVTFDGIADAIRERGEVNGHSDWRGPEKEDGMLGIINAPDSFDKDDWYWTSSPYGSRRAWAVSFEDGNVSRWFRDFVFRVRPVRSIIASSL